MDTLNRFLRRQFLGIFGLMIAISGCGSGELPYEDNSKDSAAFAKSIKQLVLGAVADLRQSKQPADTVRVIVQTLSELDACPTGENLKIYQDLYTCSKELLSECEKGRPAGMLSSLDEIAKLANALPGEVTIAKETGRD